MLQVSLNYCPKRSWLGNRPVTELAAAPGAWEEEVVAPKESVSLCSTSNLSQFQLVPDRCLCLLGWNKWLNPDRFFFSSKLGVGVGFTQKKKGGGGRCKI